MSRQSHGLRNCSPNANEHYDNGLGDMPSLEYAPPINRASHVLPQLVPSLQSQPYQNHDVDERLHDYSEELLSNQRSDSDEDICIQVPNNEEPHRKLTLHERFSSN